MRKLQVIGVIFSSLIESLGVKQDFSFKLVMCDQVESNVQSPDVWSVSLYALMFAVPV